MEKSKIGKHDIETWVKEHQALSVVASVIILVTALILLMAFTRGSNPKTATPPQPTQQSEQAVDNTKPASTTPAYELVGEFGQGGKAYVISPSDATEDKLILLGQELDKQFGSSDFARISVYTDKAQAQIIVNDPLGPAALEGAAGEAYDNAYVAQFNVNKNTGLKRFMIYLGGEGKDINL